MKFSTLVALGAGASFLAALVLASLMVVLPKYNVWTKEMRGKATLAEAEWDRQVLVEEAKAQTLRAEEQKKQDILRAEGEAEANEIIGATLTPERLQYLFIQALGESSGQVIYVPTEAGLPILAGGAR